jgi:hypothetical protein
MTTNYRKDLSKLSPAELKYYKENYAKGIKKGTDNIKSTGAVKNFAKEHIKKEGKKGFKKGVKYGIGTGVGIGVSSYVAKKILSKRKMHDLKEADYAKFYDGEKDGIKESMKKKTEDILNASKRKAKSVYKKSLKKGYVTGVGGTALVLGSGYAAKKIYDKKKKLNEAENENILGRKLYKKNFNKSLHKGKKGLAGKLTSGISEKGVFDKERNKRKGNI